MWFFGCCQASRKEFVSRLLLSQITFIFSGLITASICAFMLNVPKINVLNEIFCIVNFRSFSVKNAILAEIREEIFLAHVFINKKKTNVLQELKETLFFCGWKRLLDAAYIFDSIINYVKVVSLALIARISDKKRRDEALVYHV